MKHLALLFALLFAITTVAAYAPYSFYGSNQSTVWNETAEIGTDLGNSGFNWSIRSGGIAGPTFSTDYFTNGTKSVLYTGGTDQDNYFNFGYLLNQSDHYNITFNVMTMGTFSSDVRSLLFVYGYNPGTTTGAYFGFRSVSGSGGLTWSYYPTHDGWVDTLVNYTVGNWSTFTLEITNASEGYPNFRWFINDTIIAEGVLGSVGEGSGYINATELWITPSSLPDNVYIDDIHVWDGHVQAEAPPPAVVNYTVTLRANDTDTSTPVNTFNTTFNSVFKTTTNGTTSYGEIDNATYSASIDADGYYPVNVNITVAGDTDYTFQLTEIPPPPVVNYTVTLRANNTNTSSPITTFNTTFNSVFKTTTNGTTSYGEIDNGTYAASIVATGYYTANINVTVAGDTAYVFQLSEIPPPPPAPVVNYTVTIRMNNTNTSTPLTTFNTTFNSITKTTTNGTISYGGINNGTYSTTARATGFNPMSASIGVAGDTVYTFQAVPTIAPTPPAPSNATNVAFSIIIAMVAIAAILGIITANFVPKEYHANVIKYGGAVIGLIAVVALIVLLATL